MPLLPLQGWGVVCMYVCMHIQNKPKDVRSFVHRILPLVVDSLPIRDEIRVYYNTNKENSRPTLRS
jgi:hypothetical protein